MKIIYDEEDLKRILKKHHSYSNEPIKVGYETQDVLNVVISSAYPGVIVTFGKEDDDNE